MGSWTAPPEIIDRLKTVIDPELGINIVDLGLVRSLQVDENTRHLAISMTMTTPGCPMQDVIVAGVEQALAATGWTCTVRIEFLPPWSPADMSADGRRALGLR